MSILTLNDTPGQFPPSWYAATTPLPAPRPPLRGAASCDVAIVGAGITGLHAALALRAHGLSVTVLEAHRAGWGASGRNGGQVGSDFNKGQRWLEARMGHDAAQALWALAGEATDLLVDFCAAHAPEARFVPGIATGITRPQDFADIEAEVAHLDRHYPNHRISALDADAFRELVKTEFYHGGTLNMRAGHVHPLRYTLALAREAEAAGAAIHEGATVRRIAPGPRAVLHTDDGQLTAAHVILAGNGYLGGLAPRIAARVMPVNSFMGATAPLGNLADDLLSEDIAVCDGSQVVNYFRLTEDRRLLFGGRANFSRRFPKDIRPALQARMETMFPALQGQPFTHVWGGTLGVTTTRLPYVTRLAPNMLSAGGYSGHGLALAGLAGKVMAEAIAGQANRFDTLAALPVPPLPLGPYAQGPLLALAMTWAVLRDRLGF